MPRSLYFTLILFICFTAAAQKRTAGLVYLPDGHPRHILDVYSPEPADARRRPVMFWIHGGGWQAGDKSDVGLKPEALVQRGFVFVSTNYRLFPQVSMDGLMDDVTKSLAWVHKNIANYGGDPTRIFVGGHSAGAQVAALLCTDDRYLKRESVPFQALKGCVPVDGDTYDVPKIILTAEHRQAIYGGKMPTNGHRQKFGNDPEKHINLSAVTHIAKDKGIPPFFILYFSGNPDTQAQAKHLEATLKAAGIPTQIYGKSDSNHIRLNDELGHPGDPATQELYKFLEPLTGLRLR
jgi:acetyl esterase/lipase